METGELLRILRELQVSIVEFIPLDDRSRDAKRKARELCFQAIQMVGKEVIACPKHS